VWPREIEAYFFFGAWFARRLIGSLEGGRPPANGAGGHPAQRPGLTESVSTDPRFLDAAVAAATRREEATESGTAAPCQLRNDLLRTVPFPVRTLHRDSISAPWVAKVSQKGWTCPAHIPPDFEQDFLPSVMGRATGSRL
jgi:hypothetical protein